MSGKRGDKRLRIGYLSTDFGEHPTSHLMRSFWQLQREHGRVRATCFARSHDGSEQRVHLMRTCEEWVELTGLPWAAAAEQIRQRRVHLLVDLNGHCGRPQFEILAFRAAPLQLTYMGHPGTSGAAYVHYVLTDPVAAPPRARSHFSEHVLSLSQWHVTDYRFAHAFNARGPAERPTGLGVPPPGAPPAGVRRVWPEHTTRATLGLPRDGFVLATFLQLYKVTPRVYDVWLNALRVAPITTRLWLLEFPRGAVANLLEHAAAAGVSRRRLLSAPTAERSFHLARIALADLVLDTTPYAGHTTTGDALWMGTPVLSLPGEMMQSRIAAGYAANAGCPQPRADSLRAYEATAAAVAARPLVAAAMRTCLARGRWTHAAFDARRWVHHFDEGARFLWEIHRHGLRPMHVLLPSRHMMGGGG